MNKAKEHLKEIENLVKELATETDKVKLSEKFKEYMDFMAKFHNYSWYNTFWIMAQSPQAERVAGFRKWNELKRTIKKGEHGIRIIYPIKREFEKINGNGEAELQEHIFFNVGYVFDIKQTEGKELPRIESPSVEGDNYEYLLSILKDFCKDNSIAIEFKGLLQNALYGYTRKEKEQIIITIKEQDNKNTQAQTLMHEITHALEHTPIEERKTTRQQEEIQADGVGYVVSRYFKMEHKGFNYLALYDADYKKIMDNFKVIARVSKKLINYIEEKLIKRIEV